MAGLGGDPRHHDLGRGAGEPRRAVMLGEPVAAIAERVDMPRQLDRFQQRVARGDALPHRRLVENAELQHGDEITPAAVGWHARGTRRKAV